MTTETRALTIIDRVEQSPVVALLDANTAGLMELLPDEAAVARFKRVVIQAIVKNPDLLTCTPESVIGCVFEAAAAGWEPTGAIGGAYMVPFKSDGVKRAQLIPDYRGIVRLVTKPPSDVLGVEARLVKEGDEFSYELGTEPLIRHTPSLDPARSSKATTHVYAVAQLRDGRPQADVEDRAGIERLRARGRSGDKGPWATDWDEMAKTKIVKRLCKLLPIRPEIRSVLAREDELIAIESAEEAAAQPAPQGETKTERLASRLAFDDLDPEGQAAADTSFLDDAPAAPPAPMSQDELKARVKADGIDLAVAERIFHETFPDAESLGSLTDVDRGAYWVALEAVVGQEAASSAGVTA